MIYVSKTDELHCIILSLLTSKSEFSEYRVEKVKESIKITNDMLTIELKAAQDAKQRYIEAHWPLELDPEANELIGWIKNDFLNNALQPR